MRTYFKDEDDIYVVQVGNLEFECWPQGWSLKAPTSESLFDFAVFNDEYDELEVGTGFKTLEEADKAAREFIKNYNQQ